ncbi:MipA/OmpV family protein [Sphingopyxis sp. KK2]|uniref:MipA/OmpV family protein n=1 Tax=Sphingopyxis sp. KK2 TaxID=1855727 RepID=UPI0015C2CE5E|nr:MipA/OmpV family protein [Sphingopyxis sp. KK2]
MPMPAFLSRFALSALLLAAAAPAQAMDGPALGYDLAGLDVADAAPIRPAPLIAPAAYLQDREIDESILLPTASPEGDDDDRKWARDYISVAGGVITAPSYNGSDDRVILPGFYVRGRLSGFAFSTRGTNFQVDLIRQKRGQKTDLKFGPIINLRSDRTGRIKDVQVEALGEKKMAVELGVSAGITHTGIVTSGYDQVGLRVVGLKDISGKHGSWVVSPTIDYGTPLSKRAFIGVSASTNIYGKGFGRYYFDVDPLGSAASGLPVYNRAGAKATAGKYTLGIAGAYGLSGDLRKGFVLIGGAQYGRMLGRYADSPIVADAGSVDQWLGGIGLAYQF